MKTFNDLEFKNKFNDKEIVFIPDAKDAKQAILCFDNNYGVSVISGFGSYSNESKPFEVAILFNNGICYTTDITNDVIGHCDKDDVTDIMKKVQDL